jgi:hypothetical protein
MALEKCCGPRSKCMHGVNQAVNRWIPIAADCVRFQVSHMGLAAEKLPCGNFSSSALNLLSILIQQKMFYNPPPSGTGTIAYTMAYVPTGLSLIQPHDINKMKVCRTRLLTSGETLCLEELL